MVQPPAILLLFIVSTISPAISFASQCTNAEPLRCEFLQHDKGAPTVFLDAKPFDDSVIMNLNEFNGIVSEAIEETEALGKFIKGRLHSFENAGHSDHVFFELYTVPFGRYLLTEADVQAFEQTKFMQPANKGSGVVDVPSEDKAKLVADMRKLIAGVEIPISPKKSVRYDYSVHKLKYEGHFGIGVPTGVVWTGTAKSGDTIEIHYDRGAGESIYSPQFVYKKREYRLRPILGTGFHMVVRFDFQKRHDEVKRQLAAAEEIYDTPRPTKQQRDERKAEKRMLKAEMDSPEEHQPNSIRKLRPRGRRF